MQATTAIYKEELLGLEHPKKDRNDNTPAFSMDWVVVTRTVLLPFPFNSCKYQY
jgi:hypothetical protein